jgi:hypothetical protein
MARRKYFDQHMRGEVNMNKLRAAGAALLCAAVLSVPVADSARAADGSLQTRIQRVEDHDEIERLMMEYGRTLDHADYAAYSRLFAAKGEWVGSFGTFTGPAAIEAAVGKAMSAPSFAALNVGAFHLMTNAIIDVNGDHATAVSKWSFVRIVDKKPVITYSGRYHDTLVRENGHWRFQRRVTVSATDPDPK